MRQTPAHDWFAEAAESYVRYVFSKAGYEVFGESKWGADIAIRRKRPETWLRVEVRSTEVTGKTAAKKSRAKLRQFAELLVEVDRPTSAFLFRTRYFVLRKGIKKARLDDPSPAQLKAWINAHY